MEKIRFSNISRSPMAAYSPAWQEKIMERVSVEYSSAAVETSEKIREEFEKISADIKPGYFPAAFNGILMKTPRYVYIKHIETPFGKKYDAEIDLIFHTVNFIQIETE
jgi:hypothetical protein